MGNHQMEARLTDYQTRRYTWYDAGTSAAWWGDAAVRMPSGSNLYNAQRWSQWIPKCSRGSADPRSGLDLAIQPKRN